MDWFKLKLASTRLKPQPRFQPPDPTAEITQLEKIGALPNNDIKDLACPNLNRKENVSFTLSNYTEKTSVIVELKWRPNQELGCVTLFVDLKLIKDGITYVYSDVETYRPKESSIETDRFMQYGSNGSKFKLVLLLVYRTVRIIFRGQMKVLGKPDEVKFVKLNLVSAPSARLYDFKTHLNADCFGEQWKAKRSNLSLDQTIEELAFSDRVDQLCRFVGECCIFEGNSSAKSTIFLWGFHSKTFPNELTQRVHTKRILAHLTNGQALHLCLNSLETNSIEVGYTCFTIRPVTVPIEHPSVIDWSSIDKQTKKFEVTVHGQGLKFNCKATRDDLDGVFSFDLNGTEGWATVSLDDSISPDNELEIISKAQAAYKEELESIPVPPVKPEQIDDEGLNKMLVLDCRNPSCLNSEIVGAKASSLALLTAYSVKASLYQVPKALVLSRYAYDLITKSNESLAQEMKNLDEFLGETQELDQLEERCQKLSDMFKQSTLPEIIKVSLEEKLKECFGDQHNDIAFAVRSSSWGEDGEDMSAAGQLTTELNVRGFDAIVQAVKNCFASKYSYQNVEYKRQRGLSPNLPMAVIVQQMVNCEKAGVMFTCDPITGNDTSTVITANFGLGESVVSGQADPDTIKVEMDPEKPDLIKKTDVTVGKKSVIMGERSGQFSDHDRANCCLNDDEIQRLTQCSKLISGASKAPRDIEWGLEGGQIYLFQSRPVTSLDLFSETEMIHEFDRPSRAEDEWTTRVNFNEVFPYAVTPFTMSYYIGFWVIYATKMPIMKHVFQLEYVPECAFDLLNDSYHTFFTLRRSFVLPIVEGAQKSLMMKSQEIGFFGHQVDDQPKLMKACKNVPYPPMPYEGFRFDMLTASFRRAPIKTICREYDTLKMVRKMVNENQLVPKDEPNRMFGLFRQMVEILRYVVIDFENHYLAIMLGGKSNQVLHEMLAQYIHDPSQLYSALNKFLSAASNVISAEIPRRIEKMANTIKSKSADEVKQFVAMSETEALEYLEKGEVGSQFKEFLERFGHRCYNEFEAANRPWREDRIKIVEMLQKSCSSDQPVSERQKIVDTDKIIDSLNINVTFKDRIYMKHILVPRCQELVAAREFTKDLLIAYLDVTRIASRKLAVEMRKNLRLPDAELFYFLSFHEILPLIEKPQPAIVSHAVRRRQMFKRVFKEPWKFEEIIEGYNLIPLHMRPQKDIDESLLNAPKLVGSPGSSGRSEANVCIINGYDELKKIRPGDILVTHSTDIAFSTIFPIISGVITEVGGLISHGAVVAREYGLPSLIGVVDATKILKDGERVILDANIGQVIRLSMQQSGIIANGSTN